MRPDQPRRASAIAAIALAAIATTAITATNAGPRHELGPDSPGKHVAQAARREPLAVPPKPRAHTPAIAANRSPVPTAPYGASGVLISIDPETGRKTMPSPEARRASGIPDLDRSVQGLVVERKANGSKMVDLQGRFQEYMVLELTPDGRKVERCVRPEELGTVPAPAGDAAPPAASVPSTEGR